MVVLGVDLEADRSVPAALDTAPNVVCAIARPLSLGRLGYLSDVFGASRFVCASDGRGDGGSVFADVSDDAELAGDARDAVLYGNAEALARGTYAATHLS